MSEAADEGVATAASVVFLRFEDETGDDLDMME